MKQTVTDFPKIAADTLPKCLRLGTQRWGDKVYMRRADSIELFISRVMTGNSARVKKAGSPPKRSA